MAGALTQESIGVRLPVVLRDEASCERFKGGNRLLDQRERRAQVLATTRSRIAELGSSKVTLRMLASDCETTVQTIFNTIGNRQQVFSYAISEVGLLVDHLARRSGGYPAWPIAHADLIGRCIEEDGECIRQLALAMGQFDGVGEEVRRFSAALTYGALREMRSELREGVDLAMLADTMSAIRGVTVFEWARDSFDSRGLRQNLVSRIATMLMGAMVSKEADKVDRWLSDYLLALNARRS